MQFTRMTPWNFIAHNYTSHLPKWSFSIFLHFFVISQIVGLCILNWLKKITFTDGFKGQLNIFYVYRSGILYYHTFWFSSVHVSLWIELCAELHVALQFGYYTYAYIIYVYTFNSSMRVYSNINIFLSVVPSFQRLIKFICNDPPTVGQLVPGALTDVFLW